MSDTRNNEIHVRHDLNLTNKASDESVIIHAPQWVEKALLELSDKLRDKKLLPITFTVKDRFGNVEEKKFTHPLSLADLQLLARNEEKNTDGFMKEYYDNNWSPDIKIALKDLAKQCVVVGRDKVVAVGGYPDKEGNERRSLDKNQHEILICDLAGLQFQASNNTGRACLVYKNPPKQNKGTFDDKIFENVVGSKKKKYSDSKGARYKEVKVKFPGSQEETVKFDTLAYQQFVKQDFILAANALYGQAKTNELLDFRFLKYGAGFFAQALVKPDGKDPQVFIEEQIRLGISQAIDYLIKHNPEVFDKIKCITLPFYTSEPTLSQEAKVFLAKNNVVMMVKTIDALERHNDPTKPQLSTYTIATTNNGDVLAAAGNEMGVEVTKKDGSKKLVPGSVDAMIGCNVSGGLKHLSPALNPVMKMQFTNTNKEPKQSRSSEFSIMRTLQEAGARLPSVPLPNISLSQVRENISKVKRSVTDISLPEMSVPQGVLRNPFAKKKATTPVAIVVTNTKQSKNIFDEANAEIRDFFVKNFYGTKAPISVDLRKQIQIKVSALLDNNHSPENFNSNLNELKKLLNEQLKEENKAIPELIKKLESKNEIMLKIQKDLNPPLNEHMKKIDKQINDLIATLEAEPRTANEWRDLKEKLYEIKKGARDKTKLPEILEEQVKKVSDDINKLYQNDTSLRLKR